MESTNREFEMVYSRDELERKVEELKMRGYNEKDIHVLANNNDLLNSVETQTGIETKEADSFTSRFKSFFSGEDAVRAELDKLEVEDSVIDRYKKDLENGGMLLYTDHQNLSREDENFSAFGDDTRPLDSDEEKRNTALEPFGRDIERDERKHNDANIHDKDVKADFGSSGNGSNEIYTREVPREEQHRRHSYDDETRDSRLEGAEIHPTGGQTQKNESDIREKELDHEPELASEEGTGNLNREEGVNRRQDEPSPGVDPNLGPAPFGRDSEEEHLLNDRNDDFEQPPRSYEKTERKDDIPPTPRLF